MLSYILGTAVVAGTLCDLVLTVFQPSLRGPISKRLNRAVWSAIRSAARHGESRLLTFGGPLAVLADLALWVGGVVIGFAMLYLPALEDFSYSSMVPFGDHDAIEALYASGVVAFTIGFGDIVASTDVLRLATVAEAATGAGIITASLTYVLSVYPIVTQQRAAALRLSDLHVDNPAVCAELLRARGLGIVDNLHGMLLRNRQQLQRFPVLYYFHPGHERESVYALLRSAATVLAVLRWALDSPPSPAANRYAAAIDATLSRTMDEYVSGYVRGMSTTSMTLDVTAARRRLVSLRASTNATGEPTEGAVERFAAWLGPVDHFLGGLASANRYEQRPLFRDEGRVESSGQ